jgi:hypothetical protein
MHARRRHCTVARRAPPTTAAPGALDPRTLGPSTRLRAAVSSPQAGGHALPRHARERPGTKHRNGAPAPSRGPPCAASSICSDIWAGPATDRLRQTQPAPYLLL